LMLNFLLTAIAFLFARAAWHYTLHRAREMDVQPILWLLRTTLLLAAYAGIVGAIIMMLLYAMEKKI
jgi:hypothetical protein